MIAILVYLVKHALETVFKQPSFDVPKVFSSPILMFFKPCNALLIAHSLSPTSVNHLITSEAAQYAFVLPLLCTFGITLKPPLPNFDAMNKPPTGPSAECGRPELAFHHSGSPIGCRGQKVQ